MTLPIDTKNQLMHTAQAYTHVCMIQSLSNEPSIKIWKESKTKKKIKTNIESIR